MSSQSPYAAAAAIPLIKSPSLRVPKKVELPPDIHPLPDSVTPYFVYPFTLEPHVLTLESSRRTTIAAHSARREAFLLQRESDKARRKREALRRIAPGFEQGVLVPDTRNGAAHYGHEHDGTHSQSQQPTEHQRSRSVMDELVEQLAELDARASPPSSVPQPPPPPMFPPPPPPVNQRLS